MLNKVIAVKIIWLSVFQKPKMSLNSIHDQLTEGKAFSHIAKYIKSCEHDITNNSKDTNNLTFLV
jgi:hypothetical protein